MSNLPYTSISADTHAGASVIDYRQYLDAKHQKLFDEWRGSYRNPQRKHIGSKKHKNWDDAERMADLRTRLAHSPLGAGALAGSTLPLDRSGPAVS